MSSYQYMNIFNKEGKLVQIENALEAINSANPVVIGRNKSIIVCAAKKLYKPALLDEQPTCLFRISNNVHSLCTGLPADVDQVITKCKNLYFKREYDLGMEITPDILSTNLADKAQRMIQSTGERAYCYSMALFGFDNTSPSIYFTDISGISYPYFAVGMGEKSNKINMFLEKNFNVSLNDSELQEVVVQSLMQAIGEDSSANELSVYVLERGVPLKELDHKEIDTLLQRIADK
ncbi:hypothetical protein H311_01739 [Anncaliia algerae PRA109]|nr:hypothetical protein H311_01739 [Anncaliia algerae PRA109]